MSLGLINERKFELPATLALLIGTPSIIIRGSLEAFNDEPPRTRIVAPAPGAPPEFVITTPGLLPTSRSRGEVIAPLLKSFELTATIDPVTSFFLTVP